MEELQHDWETLSLAERGRRVGSIVRLGVSRRAIARALKCSEGILRRNEAIASLPDEDQAAIAQGEPAEKFLKAKQRLRGAERQQKRLCEEQSTSRLSSDAARQIAEWIKAVGGIGQPFRECIFQETRGILWSIEAIQRHHHPKRPVNPSYHQAKLSPTILEKCHENGDPLWVATLAESLAGWLLRAVPEPSIRDRALQSAERLCDEADSPWQLRRVTVLS